MTRTILTTPTPRICKQKRWAKLYRHIRNYYLSNSKTFQDGNGNSNFGKINSNDFQDGIWESMVKKTHKQNFHGIVQGLSRPFPEISWEFCLCVSLLPQEKGEHINNLTPTPFPGQSREFVYVYWFFSPPKFGENKFLRITRLPVIILTRTVVPPDVGLAPSAACHTTRDCMVRRPILGSSV